MKVVYAISVLPNALLALAVFAFLNFGHCYNACQTIADYWFMALVLPFCVPLIISISALLPYNKTQAFERLHALILGGYGIFLTAAGILFSITDQGDLLLWVPLAILGFMVSLPAIFALLWRPYSIPVAKPPNGPGATKPMHANHN